MTFRTLAAAAVLALAAAPALAAPLTVTLQAPVAAKTKVVAGGAVFTCEGATCVAGAAPERAFSPVSCKALAKEVGPVASFQSGARGLEAAGLDKCNSTALKPALTQTASAASPAGR